MRNISKAIGIPFVLHVCQKSRPEILDVNDFLNKAYQRYYTGNDNLINYGYYKLMGYKFDFKKYLTKYLYKQYGQWHEAYAPNKTILRKITFGRIDAIIDLK